MSKEYQSERKYTCRLPHVCVYMCLCAYQAEHKYICRCTTRVCIYVHINLNISTYVDVPHICVYMCISILVMNMEGHLHLLYRGQSTHSADIPKKCMMLHTALPEVFAGSFASSFEEERGFVTLQETGREHRLLAVTFSGGQPPSREQKSGKAEANTQRKALFGRLH